MLTFATKNTAAAAYRAHVKIRLAPQGLGKIARKC